MEENVIGKKFGKWTVLSFAGSDKHHNRVVKCKCECGNVKNVTLHSIIKGNSTCCGKCRTKELKAGQKFGRLTIIKLAYVKAVTRNVFRKRNNKYNIEKLNLEYYLCKCDCGKEKIVFKGSLTKGLIKSCGCLAKERIVFFNKNIREYNKPFRDTRLYRIWAGIKQRCYNANNKKRDLSKYNTYYKRGIVMCNDWKNDFMTFYNWAMANGYKDNLTIDRINNDGNYEPSNCRWLTIKEQARNKRNTVYLIRNGEKDSLPNWADRLNISPKLLYSRYEKKTKWFKENFIY